MYNRPSIQLGTLKAYLHSAVPGIDVRAYHLYLQIADRLGYRVYREISERTWLAESVFASLLYPQNTDAIERFFRKGAHRSSVLRDVSFSSLTATVKKITNRFIAETPWRSVGLLGISICACQLTSSLYFIRRFKAANPHIPLVAGGSLMSAEAWLRLLEQYPQIDYAVNGEGERPLRALVEHCLNGSTPDQTASIRGVVTAATARGGTAFQQLESLGDLPVPDYKDFFEMLDRLAPEKRFFPTLPLEMSRGCWWQKSAPGQSFSGCAFCNLNHQWKGYRFKQPEQVIQEVEILSRRHRAVSLAFMDNLLPPKTAQETFSGLAAMKKDFLATMKAAGVTHLQIGIEALSSRLLRKMNKGTSAIENLEVMRHCEELRIDNASNLMLLFPGSDRMDVAETLRTLDYAVYFRPLKPVRFWLGRGSPAERFPQGFGLKSVFNHPNWSLLFPKVVCGQLMLSIMAYRGDRMQQRKLWRPVEKKLKKWSRSYAELHTSPYAGPILSYRDGGDFLIIRRRRLDAEHGTHRLVGNSREIYLFCTQRRSLDRLRHRFPRFAKDQLIPFLKLMVAKKLMFEENGQYLSLAVSETRGLKG